MSKPAQLLWTAEDLARLGELVERVASNTEIAAALGRSRNAVVMKRRKTTVRQVPELPGWKCSPLGNQRWWTAERVLAGLKDFASKHKTLPTSAHVYNEMKKGHMEWPTSDRVLEFHGSMPAAWAAAGYKVSRLWVPWTQEDDDFLLEHAGTMTLKRVAARMGRSWGACKRRLYDLGAGRARDVSGYLSAMQVSALYDCPHARVERLIASGELPARKVQGGHYWRIDPEDCERIKAVLTAPKRHSYRTTPPAHGDYDRRYGLKRVKVDGKTVRMPNHAHKDGDGIHVPLTKFRPSERRFAGVG